MSFKVFNFVLNSKKTIQKTYPVEVMKTNVYSSESELESIVPVTTDREAYPQRWIAALVQMCMEKKVTKDWKNNPLIEFLW